MHGRTGYKWPPRGRRQEQTRRRTGAPEGAVAFRRWRADSQLLAAPGAELTAQLSEKLRLLPSATVRGMMPAGAKELADVPVRSQCASKEEWLAAISVDPRADAGGGAIKNHAA